MRSVLLITWFRGRGREHWREGWDRSVRGSRILGFGLGVTKVFPKSVCHIKLRGLLVTGHGVVFHFDLAESYIAGPD